MRRPRPIAAFDTLGCLLLVFMVLALAAIPPVKPVPPSEGAFAVVMTWPATSKNDMDLYVRNPQGAIAYYANLNGGNLHLEHDDLGLGDTRYARGQENFERVIVRTADPGEYVANVHLYFANSVPRTPVTVSLWAMTGIPHVIVKRNLVLTVQGQERTAFRFTIRSEHVISHDEVPFKITGSSEIQSGRPVGGQFS